MPNHPDIVAVGASAGGVEAISKLLRALPDELHAVVLIVLHRPVERFSRLREVLSSQTRMPVMIPQEGEVLQPGVCYLGHPHRHLTIGDGLRAQQGCMRQSTSTSPRPRRCKGARDDQYNVSDHATGQGSGDLRSGSSRDSDENAEG